jgi:hypothetical protein
MEARITFGVTFFAIAICMIRKKTTMMKKMMFTTFDISERTIKSKTSDIHCRSNASNENSRRYFRSFSSEKTPEMNIIVRPRANRGLCHFPFTIGMKKDENIAENTRIRFQVVSLSESLFLNMGNGIRRVQGKKKFYHFDLA